MFVSLFGYLLLGIGVFAITASEIPNGQDVLVQKSNLEQLTPHVVDTIKLISDTHKIVLAKEEAARSKPVAVRNTTPRTRVASASTVRAPTAPVTPAPVVNNPSGKVLASSKNTSEAYTAVKEGSHVFPAGQCTRYVATKMVIPWNGNASTWLNKAEEFGYETSESPKQGSVIVTNEGRYGHVAVVEEVKGDSVVISEMNYAGWGKTSTREIPLDSAKIKGFITDDRLQS